MSRALLSFWYDARMSRAPATARARARIELTHEIKETARRQLAEVGASGLSLRAVARELGMVSSAVYRYYASRDELLTALIVDAFDAVGEAAEDAAANTRGGVVKRFTAVASAVRAWALANPHDYALIYGSPVPGYAAPTATVPPAVRVSAAALTVVADGVASGEIDVAPAGPIPRTVRADLARIRDEVAPGVPDDVLVRTFLVWTAMFGTISFELFGHLHGVVDDYETFFAHQMRRAGELIVTGKA
jgi:AcrR family transcriptional regulator